MHTIGECHKDYYNEWVSCELICSLMKVYIVQQEQYVKPNKEQLYYAARS